MKVPDRVVILGDKESAIMAANKLANRTNKKEIEIIIIGRQPNVEFDDANIFIPSSLVDHHLLRRSINSVLHTNMEYIQDEVVSLNLKDKSLNTRNGKVVRYDYLLVTNPVEGDPTSISGFSEDARTLDTVQDSLRLREDLLNIKRGEIVIYQDGTHSRSPIVGANLAILLANHFSRNPIYKDVKITYLNSSKVIIENKQFHARIDNALQNKGVKTTYGFKLEQLNVKNKELQSKDGSAVKYDIPIIFSPSRMKDYLLNAGFPRTDSSPIEMNFKNLNVKNYPEVFISSMEPLFTSNYWNINHVELDYITAKIAHHISGYPDPEDYKGAVYIDYLITEDERATNIVIENDGEYSEGKPSKTDYLLKLYSYHSFFGSYSQGFL
ncbi:MAG: FAD-dependent oxidoreductase [Candidatus Thermoplasmatota archaeon]|nr:FAD-dependent oxidoreductase [Candidatus Thermoplasmatota archaeon]MCL5888713.1 FAD-dependent oxidoreductase [Candidatus Thermoplasmatota archaeon]